MPLLYTLCDIRLLFSTLFRRIFPAVRLQLSLIAKCQYIDIIYAFIAFFAVFCTVTEVKTVPCIERSNSNKYTKVCIFTFCENT